MSAEYLTFCQIVLKSFYSLAFVKECGGTIGFDTSIAMDTHQENMVTVFFYRSFSNDFIEALPRSAYKSFLVQRYGESDVAINFYL